MTEKKQTRNERGPYQIVHDFKFTALNVKDDYSFLDTLDHNGKLEYIKTRLDRLHRLGYGGVVMNVDYKNYLKDPEAFRLFFTTQTVLLCGERDNMQGCERPKVHN
jgi:hypothetical protein